MLAKNDLVPGATDKDTPASHPGPDGNQPTRNRAGQQALKVGRRQGIQPVRIGRVDQDVAAHHAASGSAENLEPAETPLVVLSAKFDAQKDEIAEMAGRIDALAGKIEAMKDGFDVLEAHMSVGLAKSISAMIKTEVAAAEEHLASRNRYRTRYRAAAFIALVLIAVIGIDRYVPFVGRALDFAGL